MFFLGRYAPCGGTLCAVVMGVLNCVHDGCHSTHGENAWLLIWAADLKPLFGCRRINGQSRKPLELNIRNLAVHELNSQIHIRVLVRVLIDHLIP